MILVVVAYLMNIDKSESTFRFYYKLPRYAEAKYIEKLRNNGFPSRYEEIIKWLKTMSPETKGGLVDFCFPKSLRDPSSVKYGSISLQTLWLDIPDLETAVLFRLRYGEDWSSL